MNTVCKPMLTLAIVSLFPFGEPHQTDFERLKKSLYTVNVAQWNDVKKLSNDQLKWFVFNNSHEYSLWWVRKTCTKELLARKAFTAKDWCKVLENDIDPFLWTSYGELMLKENLVFTKQQRLLLRKHLLNIESQLPPVGFQSWMRLNNQHRFCSQDELVKPRISRLKDYIKRLEIEQTISKE